MRENINKVSQRGERLDSLQDKTDNLAVSAQGFRRGANRVRKAMWYKDMKYGLSKQYTGRSRLIGLQDASVLDCWHNNPAFDYHHSGWYVFVSIST